MSGVDVGRLTWCQTGCRLLVSVSGTAWQLRTVSHDVHGLRTVIANEGWPPIYTILAGSVSVAETAEMGGAISSVAGENRSRLSSRSVGRRSQTFWKPWECKFVE